MPDTETEVFYDYDGQGNRLATNYNLRRYARAIAGGVVGADPDPNPTPFPNPPYTPLPNPPFTPEPEGGYWVYCVYSEGPPD